LKVRGAVFVSSETDLVVEDLTMDPDPGPGEVLVRYGASGLCHSDLHMMERPEMPPGILGHEGSGTVAAVGDNVAGIEVGDRVVASFVPSCGVCWHCLRGETQHCEWGGGIMGGAAEGRYTRPDGTKVGMGLATFAEAAVLPQQLLVKVNTELPVEQLALIGCGVTTGAGAVLNTARVTPGSSVAIIGCGGVGQAAVQGARIAGATTIVAVDTVQSKLDIAMKLGATHGVLAGSDADPVDAVREITSGRGVDYALEVIGHGATLAQAYAMTRKRGVVVAVGLGAESFELPVRDMIMSEKQLRGSFYGSSQVATEFPRLIQFAESGQLDLGLMVSRMLALEEINDGFRAMKAGEVIRSVISYG
jgi:S-(hydroxymethyl)glutathione dehydrogenase/alcohol dehydrogenase